MKKYAIIVAGGKGLRMGMEVPKQFLPVGGKPVLMRTLEAFKTCVPDVHLVLVLPVSQQDYTVEVVLVILNVLAWALGAVLIILICLVGLQTEEKRVFIRYPTDWHWFQRMRIRWWPCTMG